MANVSINNETWPIVSNQTIKRIVPLADARFSAVDPASADAEFGADLRLHHAVHITVQNGEFQSGKMQGFYNGIMFAEIGLLLFKAIHGIHGQRLVIGKINVIRLFGFSAQTHKFAVYFAVAGKFNGDILSFAVFTVDFMNGSSEELIQETYCSLRPCDAGL